MEKHKKWCLAFVILIIIPQISIGYMNYKIDPYQQYSFNNPTNDYMESRSMYSQRYLAAGFAENLDYETILVGSSMSENFIKDSIDKSLNTKSAKLSISGGTPYEIKNVLNKAISTGKTKTALICIDVYMYNNEVDFKREPYPDYLYDNNSFNDVSYLLSHKIFIEDSLKLKNSRKDDSESFDLNKLYLDNSKTQYSYDTVLNGYEVPIYSEIKPKDLANDFSRIINYPEDDETFLLMKDNFTSNLLSVIENNKNVDFKLFFPPNSILFWNRSAEYDGHIRLLKFKQYMFEALKDYDNVELYDFQDIRDITYNLSYYKDSSHYSAKVGNLVLDLMSRKENLVTEDNYMDKIKNLSHQIETVSFEEIKSMSN